MKTSSNVVSGVLSLACLILCSCEPAVVAPTPVPGHPGVVMSSAPGTVIAFETVGHHPSPPPGCEITQTGKYYSPRIGDFDLAPYALYDTRQGAIDCAWLCYRAPTSIHEK